MWNGGQDVLEQLAQSAGTPVPAAALASLDDGAIDALFATPEDKSRVNDAFGKLTRYLASTTWFDRAVKENTRLADFRSAPVAYFCAEFGIASWLPIYSGGLGVLA